MWCRECDAAGKVTRMPLREIFDIVRSFDVISFDVFDTLLLRPYMRPTDLFWKIEVDEGAKGFAAARLLAERRANAKARAKGLAEATFDEIYAEIPEWREIQPKELAAEEKCLTANPEMVEIYNATKGAGKKVVITSDMYLPEAFLQGVLRKSGIDGWDGFYLSNRQQAQKRTGTLYERLLADQKVAAEKVLHVGDNMLSDVDQANKAGIVAYGYQKVCDKFLDECPFVRTFLGRRPSLDKRLLVGAMAMGWHLFKCEHGNWSYWNRIGYLFAGTLGYLYMKFVGEDARRRGVKHLMFVARDGYVLQKIFKELYPDFRTDYFYASRAQALLAIQYFGRTKIGAEVRRRYCLAYLSKYSGMSLSAEEEERYVGDGILPPRAKELYDGISAEMMDEARRYLSGFGIDKGDTAIVDGNSTHMTMQRFVDAVVGYDVFAYYLFTNLPGENSASLCCSDWDMRYLKFSEFLFGAPTPPLETMKDGVPTFKKDISFFESFKMELCPEIEAGAVACARCLNAAGLNYGHGLWLDWNEAFMDDHSAEDEEMFSLARDSIAIGHESGYVPVLSKWPAPKVIRILGRTLVRVDSCRKGINHYRVVKIAGRIPVCRMKMSTAYGILSFLRKLRKKGGRMG